MGTCLQGIFAKSNSTPPTPSQGSPTGSGGATGRRLKEDVQKQEDPPDQRCSLNNLSNNNSVRGDTKIFTNNASTGIGFSEQERRSSIFLGNPFETSSILMKNLNERTCDPKEDKDGFYTLIDKVYFIRKSMDAIKVSSPHGESQLNCPINSIVSTFYLTQGLPLESIKEITMGKIIQTANSPINIVLKIKCLTPDCNRRLKLTFSKSIIDIAEIECDKCQKKDNWALLDLESNFPVWGDGRKLELEQDKDKKLPSPLRALGCISCLKYNCLDPSTCKEFDCGCLLCESCYETNPIQECHICEQAVRSG